MTCCPNKEWWQYVVEWCANWVRVDQIVSYKHLRPEDRFFEYTSDYITFTDVMPAWWTPWACNCSWFDFEPVTISSDGCITKEPWIARWEILDWTPIQKLYDRFWNDVTFTHTLCLDWWEEKYDVSTPTFFCVDWITTVSRIDLMDYSSWTPLVVGSIWLDIYWVMIAQPTGTLTPWACWTCKMEIFAVHEKVYVEQITAIPTTHEAYWIWETLSSMYGWAAQDASNTYIHLIYWVNSWNATIGWWSNWQDYNWWTNPDWVLLTDVATVQAITDLALADMWLSIWDAIYAITTDLQPIWFLSPNAVSVLWNPTYIHPYFWINAARNSYDRKADVVNVAPYTSNDVLLWWGAAWYTCRPIQQVKYRNTCTNVMTYEYITEDWTWTLLPASAVIPNFSELNIKSKCPEVVHLWFESWVVKRDTATTVLLANRRSDSYWALMAQYKTWVDEWQYDALYVWWAPVWTPRNHYYRVKIYDASNTLVSNTILWPYAVDNTGSTYIQFLSDVSNLTSWLSVALVWTNPSYTWWWYQIEYHNTIWFSIIFEHWVDNHSWWIVWNPDIKQCIRYESSWPEVRDSVIYSWDINNPAADSWGWEWTNMRWVSPNINTITI